MSILSVATYESDYTDRKGWMRGPGAVADEGPNDEGSVVEDAEARVVAEEELEEVELGDEGEDVEQLDEDVGGEDDVSLPLPETDEGKLLLVPRGLGVVNQDLD